MPEREITEPVDLCLPDGRLNPDAVGWTRRPLHTANLRGWGRTKRWEYWGFVSPEIIVSVQLSSVDYAGVHGIYILERASGAEHRVDAVVPFARHVHLPDRSGVGRARCRSPKLAIVIDNQASGTTVRAVADGVTVDLRVDLPDGHESLGVVVPWSERRFQYTVKDVGRAASGTVQVAGRRYHLDAADTVAALDHGRGRWPYAITWNWAAGGRPGRGLQLGGRWTDGTGMTENALLVDGKLHKIGETLRWEYDRDDYLTPWRISGTQVDAEFYPFHERRARTQLGVVASDTHQCFGSFSGWALTDAGDRVRLDGLVGWAEQARQRW